MAFWRDPDLSNNNFFLRGPFRDRFKSEIKAGDKLLLRTLTDDPEKPDGLDIRWVNFQPALTGRRAGSRGD